MMISGAGMEDKMLSVKELATQYRISPLTIYRMIKAGKIPAYKVGKSIRIPQAEAEKVFKLERR